MDRLAFNASAAIAEKKLNEATESVPNFVKSHCEFFNFGQCKYIGMHLGVPVTLNKKPIEF